MGGDTWNSNSNDAKHEALCYVSALFNPTAPEQVTLFPFGASIVHVSEELDPLCRGWRHTFSGPETKNRGSGTPRVTLLVLFSVLAGGNGHESQKQDGDSASERRGMGKQHIHGQMDGSRPDSMGERETRQLGSTLSLGNGRVEERGGGKGRYE